MPQDVRTRWNSTYQMLEFALKYRQAIDKVTGDRKYRLRKLEVAEKKWVIVAQLHDILKVCPCLVL